VAIRLDTGEIVEPLELVTTVREITDEFPISRGALQMWMYKDAFEWVQIGRTIIIDRESFVNFWNERNHSSLDVDVTSK
jgi:hypothetical protein